MNRRGEKHPRLTSPTPHACNGATGVWSLQEESQQQEHPLPGPALPLTRLAQHPPPTAKVPCRKGGASILRHEKHLLQSQLCYSRGPTSNQSSGGTKQGRCSRARRHRAIGALRLRSGTGAVMTGYRPHGAGSRAKVDAASSGGSFQCRHAH